MGKRLYPSFPFLKKSDPGIIKKNRGITLTSTTTKVYNDLLLCCIKPEIEQILRKKNQSDFRRNRSTSQILIICRVIEGVHTKSFEATLLFVDFFKPFKIPYT